MSHAISHSRNLLYTVRQTSSELHLQNLDNPNIEYIVMQIPLIFMMDRIDAQISQAKIRLYQFHLTENRLMSHFSDC